MVTLNTDLNRNKFTRDAEECMNIQSRYFHISLLKRKKNRVITSRGLIRVSNMCQQRVFEEKKGKSIFWATCSDSDLNNYLIRNVENRCWL
jgi:hypothetical protein